MKKINFPPMGQPLGGEVQKSPISFPPIVGGKQNSLLQLPPHRIVVWGGSKFNFPPIALSFGGEVKLGYLNHKSSVSALKTPFKRCFVQERRRRENFAFSLRKHGQKPIFSAPAAR